MDHRDRRNYFLTLTLLILLGGLFVLRGPVRAINGGGDLIHFYVAAALFVEGGDPYDAQACADRARQAGYEHPEHLSHGSLYPPSTLAALAPLGLLGWPSAVLAWLAVNLVSCAVLVWSAAQWLAVRDDRMRWMLAALLVVAWGPVATTLFLGQLSLVVPALICVGLVLVQRDKPVLSGLLIGLACVVKPQLGLGFLLLLLLMKQWNAAIAGFGLIALLLIVGVVRLMLVDPLIVLERFLANVQYSSDSGGIMNPGLDGPMRHQMIDLRPLLHIYRMQNVGFVALIIVSLFACVAMVRLLRLGVREHLLLAASGVGLLLLMPIYHRYYDAVLMLPLLVLVFNGLTENRDDKLLWVVALALIPLFFPGPALLMQLTNNGTLPATLADQPAWKHMVVQHHSWCILIASVALVWWTWRQHGPKQA